MKKIREEEIDYLKKECAKRNKKNELPLTFVRGAKVFTVASRCVTANWLTLI